MESEDTSPPQPSDSKATSPASESCGLSDISKKPPLFSNFDEISNDPAAAFPYKMVCYPGNYSETVYRITHPRGFYKFEVKEEDSLDGIKFIWKPTQFSSKFYGRIDRANVNKNTRDHIVVNHLENLKGLCTKTGLIKSLRRYYKHTLEAVLKGYTVYDTTPTTYVVSSSCQDSEFAEFSQRFHELEGHAYTSEKVPSKHCSENVWLVKPAAENQGRGIEIFKNAYADLKKFLQGKSPNTYWIIQKYVERPLLYNNRKFDIRIWAVATWKREFFIYKPGYIRTSSHEYTMDCQLNYVHLTNNCLQQFGDKYGAFEEGNTLGFEKFAKYLEEQFPNVKIDFEKDLLSRMKDLMIDTYLATKHELNPDKRANCFELLGYDFLIDEDFRVWLIETNTNPYLGIPNSYIEGLLPKMLNDLLELVLDPLVPPINKTVPKEVPNQFELLYSERKNINLRRSYEIPLYPVAELNPLPPIKEKSETPVPRKNPEKLPKFTNKRELILKQIYISARYEKEEEQRAQKFKSKKYKRKKHILEVVKEINSNTWDKQFFIHTQKLEEKLENHKELKEADTEEIMRSIEILRESKYKAQLLSSTLFGRLITLAFDPSITLPVTLRKNIIDMTVGVSQNIEERKWLVTNNIIHSLIKCALDACVEEVQTLNMSKEATRVLYNASSMDFIGQSPYIPGLTVAQKMLRLKVIEWGGFVCLFYVDRNAKVKTVKDFCENTLLREQFTGKDLKATIASIKAHLGYKKVLPEVNKSLPTILVPEELAKPNNKKRLPIKLRAKGMVVSKDEVSFPEIFDTALDLNIVLNQLVEIYSKTKAETRKKKEEAIVRKKVRKLEEIKKREADEKERQEKREQMFQEYLSDIEQRKKDRIVVQMRKSEDSELLKKKNEERLNKKLERVRKQAESEKRRVAELEKKLQTQQELNQLSIEKHKKLLSMKKKHFAQYNRYINVPPITSPEIAPIKRSMEVRLKNKLLHLTTNSLVQKEAEEGLKDNPQVTKTLLRTVSQKGIEEKKAKKAEKSIISVYRSKVPTVYSPTKKNAENE